jgi:pyruvate,orthophosphate dikinase
VQVQVMVFGNSGGNSGTGVAFTRHRSTGDPEPWVDFLFKAQGGDEVSGSRKALGHEALTRVGPVIRDQPQAQLRRLEQAFGDMQDGAFTVINGRLWLLQTRSRKRTPQAAARIAIEGLGDEVIVLATAVSAAHGVAGGEIALGGQAR